MRRCHKNRLKVHAKCGHAATHLARESCVRFHTYWGNRAESICWCNAILIYWCDCCSFDRARGLVFFFTLILGWAMSILLVHIEYNKIIGLCHTDTQHIVESRSAIVGLIINVDNNKNINNKFIAMQMMICIIIHAAVEYIREYEVNTSACTIQKKKTCLIEGVLAVALASRGSNIIQNMCMQHVCTKLWQAVPRKNTSARDSASIPTKWTPRTVYNSAQFCISCTLFSVAEVVVWWDMICGYAAAPQLGTRAQHSTINQKKRKKKHSKTDIIWEWEMRAQNVLSRSQIIM